MKKKSSKKKKTEIHDFWRNTLFSTARKTAEESRRRRQSKGTDHALRRLGSGEFASASSPHLASGITNISTGPCLPPLSFLFFLLLLILFHLWNHDSRDPREHATLDRTLDARTFLLSSFTLWFHVFLSCFRWKIVRIIFSCWIEFWNLLKNLKGNICHEKYEK